MLHGLGGGGGRAYVTTLCSQERDEVQAKEPQSPYSDLLAKIVALCTALVLPVNIDSLSVSGCVWLRERCLEGACVLDLIKSRLDAVNKLRDVTQSKSGL